jgi:hypothetical protein
LNSALHENDHLAVDNIDHTRWHNSDDEEEEEDEFDGFEEMGYMPLDDQDIGHADDSDNNEDDADEETHQDESDPDQSSAARRLPHAPPEWKLPSPPVINVKEIDAMPEGNKWSSMNEVMHDAIMSNWNAIDDVSMIKNVMASFKLPDSSIPGK